MRFTLDLSDTPSCGAIQSTETREFTASITPRIEPAADVSATTWSIRGRVRPVLRLDPRAVRFEAQSELAQPLAEQSVRVTGLTAFETLRVECGPDELFQARVENRDRGRREFVLKVRPRSDFPVGSFAGRITLVPILKDGSTLPGKILPFGGEIVPDIQAIPAAVLLGARPVGATFEENIELYSLTGRPFEVISVSSSTKAAAAEAQSSAAPKYTVRQRIEHLSFREETLRFSVKYGDGSPTTASVPVRYHGVEAFR